MRLRLAAEARRRALAARGVGWILASKIVLALPGGSLPKWQRWLGALAAGLPGPRSCTADEAAWAVTAAARRVPGTRCLEWALALGALLAQCGIASDLRIGVRAEGPASITAHAWIECAGRTLSWGAAEGYSVLKPRASAS